MQIAPLLQYSSLKEKFGESASDDGSNAPEVVQRKYCEQWLANSLCSAQSMDACCESIRRLCDPMQQAESAHEYSQALRDEVSLVSVVVRPPEVSLSSAVSEKVQSALNALDSKEAAGATLLRAFHTFPSWLPSFRQRLQTVRLAFEEAEKWGNLNVCGVLTTCVDGALNFGEALDIAVPVLRDFYKPEAAKLREGFEVSNPESNAARCSVEKEFLVVLSDAAREAWLCMLVDAARGAVLAEDARVMLLNAFKTFHETMTLSAFASPDAKSQAELYVQWATNHLEGNLTLPTLGPEMPLCVALKVAPLLERLAADLRLVEDTEAVAWQVATARDRDTEQDVEDVKVALSKWCESSLAFVSAIFAKAVEKPQRIVDSAMDLCAQIMDALRNISDVDLVSEACAETNEKLLCQVIYDYSAPRRGGPCFGRVGRVSGLGCRRARVWG